MEDNKILFIFLLGMLTGIFKDKEDFERLKIVLKIPDVVEFYKWSELNCTYPIKEPVLDNAIESIKDMYIKCIDSNKNITEEVRAILIKNNK